MSLFANLKGSGAAEFSPCGKYRYVLRRYVEDALPKQSPQTLLWVMLNPSTADVMNDDPTIRKCIKFALRWGFHQMHVVNLYAWRSPHPDDLVKAQIASQADIVGPKTDEHIVREIVHAQAVVVAWGDAVIEQRRAEQILMLIETPLCLGWTKQLNPRHPLWADITTPLIPFPKDVRHRRAQAIVPPPVGYAEP